MEQIARPLSKNLAFLLRKHRMTFTELSRASGSARSTIAGWTYGISPTDPYRLLIVASVFKLSLEDLLTKDLTKGMSSCPFE